MAVTAPVVAALIQISHPGKRLCTKPPPKILATVTAAWCFLEFITTILRFTAEATRPIPAPHATAMTSDESAGCVAGGEILLGKIGRVDCRSPRVSWVEFLHDQNDGDPQGVSQQITTLNRQ